MYRISKAETGNRIRKLMRERGISVREIQDEMELESPQSVYKWLNGKSVPTTENLLMLAKLLRVPMEEMLVLEAEDFCDTKRMAEWEKNHPPIFIAYRFWDTNPVRKADAERLLFFTEDPAQERLRNVRGAH